MAPPVIKTKASSPARSPRKTADAPAHPRVIRHGFPAALGAYLALILIAAIVFHTRLGMPGGSEMGVAGAVFTSVNALTLTGFPQLLAIDKYTPIGQGMILLLTVAGSLSAMVVGGLAGVRILRLPYSNKRVILFAVAAEFAAIVLGATLLFDADRTVFDAVLQAASAFGNSGLFTGRLPDAMSWETHLGLMPLALLGGLGLPVLMELYDALMTRRPISRHAWAVVGMTALLYLAGTGVMTIVRLTEGGNSPTPALGANHRAEDARLAVAGSSLEAVNSRTAGFPFEPVQAMGRTAPWVLAVLMAIGASPAGTGGGVKTTTLVQLVGGTRKSFRGEPAGRGFGFAIVWVGIYGATVLLTLWVLVYLEPELAPDRILFHAISAASNVGLANPEIGANQKLQWVLSGTMLAGRVAPMVILWRAARTGTESELLFA